MSTPVKQRPYAGAPAASRGGLRGPALSPLPARPSRSGRWIGWLLLTPLLLLGLTWLLGRSVEQVRVRLAVIPLAGKLLFSEPVWPILWNKQPDPPAAAPSTGAPVAGETPGTALPADYANLNNEIAARLAAVESREAVVREKEDALQEQEKAMAEYQSQMAKSAAEAEGLRIQLQGQLRTELDRVAVIRGMKTSAQVQLFAAMTDDEVLAVLKHMEADEVGKILASMDSWRSARILHRLTEIRVGQ